MEVVEIEQNSDIDFQDIARSKNIRQLTNKLRLEILRHGKSYLLHQVAVFGIALSAHNRLQVFLSVGKRKK